MKTHWCVDRKMPVALDNHLRCDQCGSDAVDTLEPRTPRDARASLLNHFKRMADEMDRIAAACERESKCL